MILICPGIHDRDLTDSFLAQLKYQASSNDLNELRSESIVVFPADEFPAYSAFHIWRFLEEVGIHPVDREKSAVPLVLICFSAGVVGGIGVAWMWQTLGGKVKALIALDGWGVPLIGNFPIHRISHDYFTHWSSGLLGTGEDNFYADPPVPHLELWRDPTNTPGCWINSEFGTCDRRFPLTAAQFLTMLLEGYQR
ncbi:MAG TPA: hypothetical protein V6D28_20550 [Leptolyngbyaceae cyanobacterium]